MLPSFGANLAAIAGSFVRIQDDDQPAMSGEAPIVMRFTNGTRLEAGYWRLIKDGKASVSSFEDRQKYGLPAPIDARGELRTALDNCRCVAARLDRSTGDILFEFDANANLQIFNFCVGYEIWHISFADGTGEYSNYVLSAKD